MKDFIKNLLECLPRGEAREKVSESVNIRYASVAMMLDKNIKSDQQELMKMHEPMVDKQDRHLSVIALVMILGSGIYFRGDFRPVRIIPTHRRFIHHLIKKTCEMFRGKQTNFTLNTNIVLLSIEGFIKDH
jgi:hypothetical protein